MTRGTMIAVLLCAALAITACTSVGDGRQATTQAPNTVVARFVPRGEVSVIEVSVSDPRPLRSVELIGPGGTIAPASVIERTRASAAQDEPMRSSSALDAGAATGFGGIGGGIGFGTGTGLPVPLTGAEAPGQSIGQVRSIALLRLPDPLGYRLEWRQWQLHLQIGDPPNTNFVSLPAPQPPADL